MNTRKIRFLNSVALTLCARSDLSLKNASKISKRVVTGEGYLLVSGAVSRPGIYEYYVGEFDTSVLPERLKNAKPDTVVRVLYPDEAVFDQEHLDSISGKPVTWGHPFEFVNSRNVMFNQRGFVRDKVKKKNNLVTANLVVQDSDLIDAITNDGQEELSTGLESDIDWTDGTDSVYGAYNGRVSNLRVNHVAIVNRARAGSEVRLDNKKPLTNQKRSNMDKEITINGVTFTVSNQVAQAVNQLVKKQDDVSAELATVTAELDNAKAERDTLQGKVDTLTAEVKDVDKLVAERQELVNSAKSLDPEVETTGKSPAEIKSAVVTKLSNSDLKGKSPEYVAARFDMYLELKNAKSDNTDNANQKEAGVLKNTHKGEGKKSPAAEAMAKRKERFKNAWKTK